ncbi:hypothetical protein Tco_0076483 [Tanacetum coccineum]
MDVGSVNIPYLLARYLRMFSSGRKHGAMISGGQFVARLDEQFGLITEQRLQELTICEELDDTWGCVALGPERQQVVAAGALEVAKRLGRLEEDVYGLRGALGDQREVLDSMACDSLDSLYGWSLDFHG